MEAVIPAISSINRIDDKGLLLMKFINLRMGVFSKKNMILA
jgi:hypothetical protein